MNYFLIGYRGVGKTTIGMIMSIREGKRFYDTDELICENEGSSIADIFNNYGEKKFREIEKNVLRMLVNDLANGNGAIVSTGGGIVLDAINREIIKKSGKCVYLFADNDIIFKRIDKDEKRPALTNLKLKEEIEHILNIRKPIYESIADVSIDTGITGITETADIIHNYIERVENDV